MDPDAFFGSLIRLRNLFRELLDDFCKPPDFLREFVNFRFQFF